MSNNVKMPNLDGLPSSLNPVVIRDLDHLYRTVSEAMQAHGPMVNLNHLDVSGVRIFDGLFENSAFNGCIDKWDTSSAQSMSRMFKNSAFTGDLSKWDVSALEIMNGMFEGAAFNGDLSQWRLSNRFNSIGMFNGNFRGQMPILNANHVYVLCASMLGGVQQMNTYAKWSDFSYVHACMLLEAPKECTWASQEVVRWALMVGEMGRSMGLDMQEQRVFLVEQYKTRSRPDQVMVVNELFDIDLSAIVP